MTTSYAAHIALFDLDHTLLPIDSDFTWTTFTNAMGWTDAEQSRIANEAFYQQYKAGRLDMAEYVRFVTRAMPPSRPSSCLPRKSNMAANTLPHTSASPH